MGLSSRMEGLIVGQYMPDYVRLNYESSIRFEHFYPSNRFDSILLFIHKVMNELG